MSEITHICFDMDGLLLNTEPLYEKVHKELCLKFGNKVYDNETKAKVIGHRPLEVVEIIIDELKLDISPEEYLKAQDAKCAQVFPSAKWMPGALKLVHHLYKNDVPMAVATSSGDANFSIKTENHSKVFDKAFKHVVLGKDNSIFH